MTDKKLLHLLDQNPEEGMGLLMEQYMGLLWSACRLYLTNPEDIRECVQETFADFYGNRWRHRMGSRAWFLWKCWRRPRRTAAKTRF